MTATQKKSRLVQWLMGVCLVTGSIALYLFTGAGSHLAQSAAKKPLQMIDRLAISSDHTRYILIPRFGELVNRALQNEKVEALVKSDLGRDVLASPPVIGFQAVGWLAGFVPDLFKLQMMKALFAGGVYYASDTSGYVLLFNVNRAGRAMLKVRNSKKWHSGFFENWYMVASNRKIYERQLDLLKKKELQPTELATRVISRPGQAIIVLRNEAVDQTHKDLLFALASAFLPARYVSNHILTVDFTKQRVSMAIDSLFNQEYRRVVLGILKKSGQKPVLAQTTHENTPFVAELGLGFSFLKPWFEGTLKNPGTARGSSQIYFHGLEKDYGLAFPEVAFAVGKTGRGLVSFLTSAFEFGKVEKFEAGEGLNLKYIRYQYYKRKRYYAFSPVVKEKGSLKWATTPLAMGRLEAALQKSKPVQTARQQRMQRLLAGNARFSGQHLGFFYSNLENLLKNSNSAIHALSPVYYPHAYGDFREKYDEISRLMTGAMIGGNLYFDDNGLRLNAALEIQ